MIAHSLFSTTFRLASQVLLNLKPAHITLLPQPQPGKSYMLYAHIPFCEVLCPYCSFNRFPFNERKARQYFSALREELRLTAKRGYTFDTLYIGGGTPTILMDELVQIIDMARDLFGIREVSCETNPNDLDDELVEALSSRVQRLSVGVQSFDDDLLQRVNRLERFGSGEQILRRIQNIAGAFDSLNIDLIFNFPGQDEAVIQRDVQMALESNANQVTYYPLMTSPSVRQQLKETIGNVSFDREAALYEEIVRLLSPHFDLSTAWTFSRKGRNLIDEYIVKSEEYVGVGSGSFSYLNGSLFVNTFSLNFYQQWVSGGSAPIAGKRRFSRLDQMRYRFMMDLFGLRLDKKQWQADFGTPVERCLPIEMLAFEKVGAFQTNNAEEITLTPRGRYLLVTLMREFFSSINRVRDQARRVVLASEPQVSPETRLSDAKA